MANQWYVLNPTRYQMELSAVQQSLRNLNPQLVQLRDGRRGFIMKLRVPDPEGNLLGADGAHYQEYRVLMAWNSDHPRSACRQYGGSVKTYFQSPTAQDIERAYRAHGRSYVPHLIGDVHPVTGGRISIPCTQELSRENDSYTMVTAVALLMNWLSAMTAAKYSDAAFAVFARH